MDTFLLLLVLFGFVSFPRFETARGETASLLWQGCDGSCQHHHCFAALLHAFADDRVGASHYNDTAEATEAKALITFFSGEAEIENRSCSTADGVEACCLVES
jgi:hypothetical protein